LRSRRAAKHQGNEINLLRQSMFEVCLDEISLKMRGRDGTMTRRQGMFHSLQ